MIQTEFMIEKSKTSTLEIKVYNESIDLIKESCFQDANGAINNHFAITNITLTDICKIKYTNDSVESKAKKNIPQLIIGILLFLFGLVCIIVISALEEFLVAWIFGIILCLAGSIISALSYKRTPKCENGLFQIFGKTDNLLYSDSFLISSELAKSIIDSIKKV